MQIDLAAVTPRTEPFRSQVCIIGAGIAGLTLAHRLTRQGIDVALVEAGGQALEPASQNLITAAHLTGEPHLGTHEGRFRAFGGASLRWGGQLLPFPSATAQTRWPISAEDLAPHYRVAEDLLAVDDLPYAASSFFAQSHTPVPTLLQQLPYLNASLSKWTPFSHRNLASTIGRELLQHPRARIYLHAQATELLLAPARDRIEAVLVRTLSGATFRFEATYIVLAAGTVETSRLLLASRSVAPEGVGNAHDQVGRNFHDHLTLPAARIEGPARQKLLNQFRPWVFNGTQHTLKLEASTELRQRLSLNPILAHLTLEDAADSPLATVRNLLTARQHGNFVATLLQHTTKLPAAALEALCLAAAAKLHHRRHISADTAVTLQLNAAQDEPSASRITLSDSLDPFGLPQPIVDWRISPSETAMLRRFAAYLREQLDSNGISADWQPALSLDHEPLAGLEDARHAMGGTCMGNNPCTSVVDANLQVHGIANLSIAGPSVFPDGSPQLPTLTMMALTLRLADRIASAPRA
jgi:choline dehydrogenase-like flavoprotein